MMIEPVDSTQMPKEATQATREANARFSTLLPFEDTRDFEEAQRGFIAPLPDGGVIKNEQGQPAWDMTRFSFIGQGTPAPETVNPSLWRQSQLVMLGGLFKVVDGLYQVRNADLSNLTIYEAPEGLIVADPLICVETARAALNLYFQHRPRRPVVAVIYSHSHIDHWGGVRGVVDEQDVPAGKVKIIAPEGFLEAAVSENVLAGNVMTRRASYMYGNLLSSDPKGQVGAGLGMTSSNGTVTLIAPTDVITHTGQRMNIAGLDFEFLLAPDSEAPAEMHWYIEQFKAVTAAENCSHTLHNTYTLRGAKIRDPLAWSKYIHETIGLWTSKAEVLYGMHHWPSWGRDRILEMLEKGRDTYRFIHDQTLRLANQGYTPVEIAEMIELPEGLARHWAVRDYYGTLNHNMKATYVHYLGWFDGNPATLHQLPPEEASKKYVAFMGGAEAVLEKARAAFDNGEYRWVAEVVNHVIFADPHNQAARELQADVLEQLGYQAESGPWRNFYLTGAKELREGVKQLPTPTSNNVDVVRAMSLDLLFDYLGVRLNASKAAGKMLTLNFRFPETQETWVLALTNSVLNHASGEQAPNADATLTLSRDTLIGILFGVLPLDKALETGALQIQGRKETLNELFSLFDTFEFWFPIVTP